MQRITFRNTTTGMKITINCDAPKMIIMWYEAFYSGDIFTVSIDGVLQDAS